MNNDRNPCLEINLYEPVKRVLDSFRTGNDGQIYPVDSVKGVFDFRTVRACDNPIDSMYKGSRRSAMMTDHEVDAALYARGGFIKDSRIRGTSISGVWFDEISGFKTDEKKTFRQLFEKYEKGNKMNRIDINALIELAKPVKEDDLSAYEESTSSTTLMAALKKKQKERSKARVEEQAENILNLITFAEDGIEKLVKDIRDSRKRITVLRQKLEDVKLARDYGMKTENFVPLLAALAMTSKDTPGALIPKDFFEEKA